MTAMVIDGLIFALFKYQSERLFAVKNSAAFLVGNEFSKIAHQPLWRSESQRWSC